MGVCKRAIIYLKRNKGRGILLFLVLTVISSALMVCLCLWKSSQDSIRELRQTYGSNFTVELNVGSDSDEYALLPVMDDEMAEKIQSVGGIKDVGKMCVGMSMHFKDVELVPGLIYDLMQREEDPAMYKDHYVWTRVAVPEGYNRSELSHYFRTNTLELVEGRHIEENDYHKVMISDEVAEKNGLEVGDVIQGEVNGSQVELFGDPEIVYGEWELEIVGIFHANVTQITNEYTIEYEIIENLMFVDSKTETELWRVSNEALNVKWKMEYNRLVFFVEDPREMDDIIERARNIKDIDWDMFIVEVDDSAYQSALTPLQTISKVSIFMLIFVMAICMILLTLILRMWVRTRKKEMGILLSMGNSQRDIIAQFIVEGLIILGIAFILSSGIAFGISNRIGNMFLSNLNANEERLQKIKEEKQEALMNGEVPDSYEEYTSLVGGFKIEAEAEAPEEIDCGMTVEVVLISAGLLLLVTVMATVLSARGTLKMKPKDILTSF